MIIQSVSGSVGTLSNVPASSGGPAIAVPVTSGPAASGPAIGAGNQPANTPVPPSSQPPSPAQLQSAVNKINKALQQSNQSLEFSVDATTKTPVVKMIDTQTGKVIQQYPSQQTLAIAESIDQYLSQHQLQQGTLLKQKA